jgi:hypothetical protein
MKYLQYGGYDTNVFMRLTLGFTLVLLGGFIVTNFMLFFAKMDLTPSSVIAYYNGSEENFHPARTYGSMLELTHGHLPMIALVLLLLTHLLIFAPYSRRFKIVSIVVPFASASMNEAAGWLVRFVDPAFAYLKIGSFLMLQTSMILLVTGLAAFLLKFEDGTARNKGAAAGAGGGSVDPPFIGKPHFPEPHREVAHEGSSSYLEKEELKGPV